MKNYKIINPETGTQATAPIAGDFLYAQPSGVTTIHRYCNRTNGEPSNSIIASIPAHLIVVEV